MVTIMNSTAPHTAPAGHPRASPASPRCAPARAPLSGLRPGAPLPLLGLDLERRPALQADSRPLSRQHGRGSVMSLAVGQWLARFRGASDAMAHQLARTSHSPVCASLALAAAGRRRGAPSPPWQSAPARRPGRSPPRPGPAAPSRCRSAALCCSRARAIGFPLHAGSASKSAGRHSTGLAHLHPMLN